MMRRRVILSLPLLAVVGAGTAAHSDPINGNTQTTETPVNAPVQSVVVDSDAGNVAVVNGAASKVVAVQHWRLAPPTTTVSDSNGVLTVTNRCPSLIPAPVNIGFPDNDCSVDLTITVPSAVTVRVTVAAGDIGTSGLSGPEQLQTSAGDVTVRDLIAPALSARSAAGDVSVTGAITRLRADTSSGAVTATLSSVPDQVQLTTSTGDVTGVVPAGSYAVTAATSTGRVDITGITNDPRSTHTIKAATSSGNVTLTGR